MKKEIDDGNVTQLKLKNPFYRLDYLKEYTFRHKKKDSIEIYYDFIEKYGDLEYDFSMIDESEKQKIIEKYKKNNKKNNKKRKGKNIENDDVLLENIINLNILIISRIKR